ncbi:MAG: anthranilate phosphoribosyltransferase [Bryobacteraceae bacterium]|nr:anthranilate phosphoribosyltransferase [Bryobacteraceae bacterium]MDW8376792.1 anthranilate phosphoribosyltransferase [Bryobacterales bacterium]
MSLLPFLHAVVEGQNLTGEQAQAAMLTILSGEATPAQIAAFLVALRMKGETATELRGFAEAMRQRAQLADPGLGERPVVDTCGTGGDGGRTFNISTIAAFVVAGCGVAVAKHGNRSLSSQCGSADLLEELGVRIALDVQQATESLRRTGFGFYFAPLIHPAMKHAQPARAELKMRTVFNLLGPLTNPTRAPYQLIGAPSKESAQLMAEALAGMAHIRRALVVHGRDGLDEVSTTTESDAFLVDSGRISHLVLQPEDFGLRRAELEQLAGGDRWVNARIASEVLQGCGGPRQEIVEVNAAVTLWLCGVCEDFHQAMEAARHSIRSQAAAQCLQRVREFQV